MSVLRAANPESLFCDYFDLNVKWRASRRAVIFDDVTLTWAELGRRSYRVANGLAALGLRQEDAVVVLLDNRLETAEIVLGVIRAGATIVPINLAISSDAIARQIQDCGAKAVVATATEAARVDAATSGLPAGLRLVIGGAVPGWIDYPDWVRRQADTLPSAVCEPGDLITVVYSSGTTGVPKGIAHSHLSRIRNMHELGRAFRISEDSVWVSSLGFYSNAAMLPFLMTLLAGGAVVVLPRFEPRAFLESVARQRGSHFLLVPLMLRTLLSLPEFDRCDVSSVELIVVGGAAVEPEVKDAGRKRFDCVLLELYGLTEGFATVTSSTDPPDKRASVGRPVAGADLKVLRDDGTEAAIGEPGEITGFSQSIMAGYLNRPDETAAAFLEDEHGRRWLRTGDIGKLDADGFLYYVGRKKDLIVSGGQNIYPADIEDVGQTHPAVDQIAVVGVPHPKWDETPVAVVTLRQGVSAAADELTSWINDRVGRRQRVAAVVVTDALPANALGKVLKRELRERLLLHHPNIGVTGDAE